MEMEDPFAADWIQVREEVPAYAYIKLHDGYRSVVKTQSFGPMVHGWYLQDGTEAHEDSQVLLDLAEDGRVLGIELLVPGKLVYDKRREDDEERCVHSIIDLGCIGCMIGHLERLKAHRDETCTVAEHMDAATSAVPCKCQGGN